MQLDPVAQGLFNHSQAPGRGRQRLARLHKSNRLMLELKRVSAPFPAPHLCSLSLLKQLAKGYVLCGQGQGGRNFQHPLQHPRGGEKRTTKKVRIAPAPSSAPSKEVHDFATCHKPFIFLRFMAGTTGLEPATSAVTGQRSNQLSYVPRMFLNNLGLCHLESSGSQLSLFSLFSTISLLWTQFWVSVDTTWTPRWTPKPPPQRQD